MHDIYIYAQPAYSQADIAWWWLKVVAHYWCEASIIGNVAWYALRGMR